MGGTTPGNGIVAEDLMAEIQRKVRLLGSKLGVEERLRLLEMVRSSTILGHSHPAIAWPIDDRGIVEVLTRKFV